MKRILSIMLLIVIIASLLSGCGTTNKDAETTAQVNEDNNYPLTVKDANGFEMTIEKTPENIISLTLGTDEMLMGLIDSSKIKALTNYADDEGISNIAKEAAKVKERVTMDSMEKVMELQPDLVFLDTWVDSKTVKQLRDSGILVYVFKTPSSIQEQKDTIIEIAHVVGADNKGEEVVAWMDEKLESVGKKLKELKADEKLSIMDYGEMGSSGAGTNFDDIVTRAGLINAVAKAGIEGWAEVSKEKIIEMNPDVIMLPSWFYDNNNSLQGMKDTLKNDKSLAGVKAIMNNNLISVPNPHISSISQYVVLGVEDVAKAAYPELFK